MGEYKYDQFNYSVGQIDPKMQSRPDWDGYYTAAKTILNAQVIPQGGVQRRWGLKYVDKLSIVNTAFPFQSEMSTLLYDNDLIYLLIWQAGQLTIYLENILIATVTSGYSYNGPDIPNLRFTQVQDRLVITNPNFPPAQLVRSNNANNQITATDQTNMYFTLNTPITAGQVLPIQFTTNGTLPTTTPQIYPGRTYFMNAINTTNIRIYSTSADAVNNVNFYTIGALGASTNQAVIQNTWTLSNITFINMPGFDFGATNYSTFTFTPSATTGTITLTSSSNIFSSAFNGGYYIGIGAGPNGANAIVRFTTEVSATVMNGFVEAAFDAASAWPGYISYVAQPVWSAALGYPAVATFFQNRLVLANTATLQNGVWLSVSNEAYNFDDSESLPDNAISWYPGGGQNNFIVALTSARALIVHTNNGAFSTPLLTEQPVTPANFTLTEQNKFNCDTIQPIFIDNQILFADTASNIINMIWSIAQSAYITNNISVVSSNLIVNPVDMSAFYEPAATDGFYALFVNSDGTMAVYQTLNEQNVGAWSQMITNSQIVANQISGYATTQSNFIHVISGNNRCWVLVQRQMPISGSPTSISGFTIDTLTATSHGIPVGTVSLITFTGTTVPASTPQVNKAQYWWAWAFDANTIMVFANAADASAQTNPIAFTSDGSSANIVAWPLTPQIFIEEVNFNVYTDAASTQQLGSPSATVANLAYLNGNVVNVKGDGYLLKNQTVFGGAITTEYAASNYEIGLNFVTIFQPLPISIPGLMGILFNPTHIRAVYVSYYNTIAAQLQGYNIQTIILAQQQVGVVPTPQTGVYLYTPMEGWNNQSANITITQPNPFPMTILGFSYILET